MWLPTWTASWLSLEASYPSTSGTVLRISFRVRQDSRPTRQVQTTLGRRCSIYTNGQPLPHGHDKSSDRSRTKFFEVVLSSVKSCEVVVDPSQSILRIFYLVAFNRLRSCQVVSSRAKQVLSRSSLLDLGPTNIPSPSSDQWVVLVQLSRDKSRESVFCLPNCYFVFLTVFTHL